MHANARRRGNFSRGWRDALRDHKYPRTKQLTWQNLGNRLGDIHRDVTDDAEIAKAYESFEEHFERYGRQSKPILGAHMPGRLDRVAVALRGPDDPVGEDSSRRRIARAGDASELSSDERHWIIQANPKRWKVFEWWENAEHPLSTWTLSWRAPELRAGDKFALWVSGQDAGVYATGTIRGSTYEVTEPEVDPYWADPPSGPEWEVELDTRLYLFDAPIRKAVLVADPEFAHALVLRMPGYRNPIPLEPDEWNALMRHLPAEQDQSRAAARPARRNGDVVITERRRGTVSENITVATPAVKQLRSFTEARLVDAYERFLGRQLRILSALLPSGERLVIDGYDDVTDCLIEAKASATRQGIRMAIGQLLDYRRHIAPGASLAILLPEVPSDDLVTLVQSLHI